MVKKILWTVRVQEQLTKIYEYILQDSYQNAGKVKEDILASTRNWQPTLKYIHRINTVKIAMKASGLMRCIITGLLIGSRIMKLLSSELGIQVWNQRSIDYPGGWADYCNVLYAG